MATSFTADLDSVKAHIDTLQSHIRTWEAREAQYAAFQARVHESVALQPTVIALDVGGMVYKTTKATLLAVEGSYFHALLASDHWQPDDGARRAYFLDLHGPTFARVLDFLRTGLLSVDGLNQWECRQLYSSMEYLQLVNGAVAAPPTTTWRFVPQPSFGANVHVSCDGRVLHGRQTTLRLCGKLFAPGSAPVSRMRLQVLEIASIVIGFCPATCTSADDAIKRGVCKAFATSTSKLNYARCMPGDVLGVRREGTNAVFSCNDDPALAVLPHAWPRTDQFVPFVVVPSSCAMTLYIVE